MMPCPMVGESGCCIGLKKGPLDSIQLLLKSPNSDRAGNIMAGLSRVAQDGLGQTPPKAFRAKGLDHFIDACDAIYDSQLSAEQLEVLKVRDQRSSAGGARPKANLSGRQKTDSGQASRQIRSL